MPAKTFLRRVAGQVNEIVATVVSSGASNAGDLVALTDSGTLDPSVMPTGIGADVQAGTASEALAAGDFVAFTGTGVVRASAASTGRDADGFVLAAVNSSATATVYLEGRNTALTGLTVGARYYLSDTTAGGFTTSPVSGTGKRHQFLGRAVSTTALNFEADDSIVLA